MSALPGAGLAAILAGVEARASEVFVGRAGELGELGRALDAARAGTGAAVLLAGQAGIGKTRLASELARRARGAGFEVLLGRSIDLVGTELPYQPFAEALRPLGEPWRADRQAPGSQLRVFEETLALLTGCAASAPVLLVLEDLHWADTSTLDLVVFLAHNVGDQQVLLLVTYRADEPSSAGRMRRLAEGVRRSGSALILDLGPLERDELTALLAAHAGASLPAAMADTIAARSEGNPFFAEELLAASGGQGVELPQALRDLLLQRVARLDHPAQNVLRLAAAAGREVGYPLLRATVELPDGALRDSLRAAVEGGVLAAEPETGSFRFRHALLAEAIYTTILPGEREELHAKLADELARSGAASPAELAPHWAAAGRTAEALAAQLAEEIGDHIGLERVYINLTDALTMLGRLRESARLGQAGLEVMRRYGIDSTLLVSNQLEALLAIGDWDEAERLSTAALRGSTSSFLSWLLIIRADLEVGRGDFDAARAHLEAAAPTVHEHPNVTTYDAYVCELALWERRWADADQAVREGVARALSRDTTQIRVWLCAKGLRAQAELAALARARRDTGAVRNWVTRAQQLITLARRAAAEASAVTPNAGGWLALAEAEYARARAPSGPESWAQAADSWERLERPPLVAYCRWREAEALVAAGASRAEAAVPLREADAIAARIGARPLLRELELLAQRARLDIAPPQAAFSKREHGPAEILGLTPREAEVLNLLARGYTNREIAATLVISVKTVSVHVSHILRKLGAPNRLEAAAIAHRLAPPPTGNLKREG
jgi:DNA-binding CsgD family transcriptional regulator